MLNIVVEPLSLCSSQQCNTSQRSYRCSTGLGSQTVSHTVRILSETDPDMVVGLLHWPQLAKLARNEKKKRKNLRLSGNTLGSPPIYKHMLFGSWLAFKNLSGAQILSVAFPRFRPDQIEWVRLNQTADSVQHSTP